MQKILCLLCSILLLFACQHQKKPANKELQLLVNMMTGEFNSAKQSAENDEYFDITLKMRPVWDELPGDGVWLYVEQAVTSKQDKPYRQRLYHVTQLKEGMFSSQVYELPNPEAAIGAFSQPELLYGVTPKMLKLRTGCAVFLKQVQEAEFSGSTDGDMCLSNLRGAQYATSKVVITPQYISSWDQGYDANNQQVWGATAGPYVFDRVK